jgi:hypothetical protein
MKKILGIILAVGLLNSCTPVQYVYVDPKDSVIREQRVIYDYQSYPLYYNPIIIERWVMPRYQPQRWTPQRPYYRPTPSRQLPPRPPRRN